MRNFKIILSLSVLLTFALSVSIAEDDTFALKRRQMVERQIKRRGVTDKDVIDAMMKVKRHLFVPDQMREVAYEDTPLPIGYGQTISQPYIVAYMTETVQLRPDDRVLEIGTGSGYQAAILAEIAKEVYTIEIIKELAASARSRLESLGYRNVKVMWGDGYKGWPEYAPFDAIVVTAAPSEIPEELTRQLKPGGRMIVPVGSFFQELYLVTRTVSGIERKALFPVRFVPMVHGKEIEKKK